MFQSEATCELSPAPVSSGSVDPTRIFSFIEADAPLRKRFRYELVDAAGKAVWLSNCEPGTWPNAESLNAAGANGEGKWRDPDENATYGRAASFKRHTYQESSQLQLAQLFEVLRDLASERLALVLGRLRDDERRDNQNGKWLVEDRRRRRYEDVPTRFFIVDFDHLSGDVECSRAVLDGHLDNFDVFDRVGYVAALTASAGIKGVRVRVVFETTEPRTLKDQKAFVEALNVRGARMDASIYSPGHIIFTADPHLFADLADGSRVDVPRPVGGHDLVWHVSGGKLLLPEAPQANTPFAGLRIERTATGTIELIANNRLEQFVAEMVPDNFNASIHKAVCSLAWSRSDDKREEAMHWLRERVIERINAVSQPQEIAGRLAEHVNLDAWHAKWAKAREERLARLRTAPSVFIGPLTKKAEPGSTAPQTDIRIERQKLSARTKDAAADLLTGSTKHYLVRPAPGFGKTMALISALDPKSVSQKHVRYLASTHGLCAQTVADIKRDLPTVANLVRHHKGRKQPGMCVNAEFGKRADAFESVGRSPRKHVCAQCPDRDRCPWIAQGQDKGAGLIAQPHSVLGSLGDFVSNLTIVDESLLSTVIQPRVSVSLTSLALDDTVKRHLKQPHSNVKLAEDNKFATDDINDTRSLLIAALGHAMPREKNVLATVTMDTFEKTTDSLLRKCQFKAFRESVLRECEGLLVDYAINLERQYQRDLAERLKQMVQGASPAHHDIKRRHETSVACVRLYEAIRASKLLGRSRVFAIRVGWCRAKVDGHWQPEYRVHFSARRELPQSFIDGGSIHLDGTASPRLWRAVLGVTEDRTEIIEADAPVRGVRTTLYPERPFGKLGFVDGGATEEEQEEADWLAEAPPRPSADNPDWQGNIAEADLAATRWDAVVLPLLAKRHARKLRADSNLHQAWLFIFDRALRTKGDVLVVAQKAVMNELRELGLPPNVVGLHFNALRGLNTAKGENAWGEERDYDLRKVRLAVVIGRPGQRVSDYELATEALFLNDATVSEIATSPTMVKRQRVVRIDAGGMGAFDGEGHPDDLVDEYIQAVTRAEVVQAVARIRQFDRDDANPCEVHVFGQHDPGLPISEIRPWSDARREWDDIAIANGMLFEKPEDNQAAYGNICAKEGRRGDGADAQREKWQWNLRKYTEAFSQSQNLNCRVTPNNKGDVLPVSISSIAVTRHFAHQSDAAHTETVDCAIEASEAMAAAQAAFSPVAYPNVIDVDAVETDGIVKAPGHDLDGFCLCEFAFEATEDNPRPYRRLALIRHSRRARSRIASAFSRGVPRERFRWLTTDEARARLASLDARKAAT